MPSIILADLLGNRSLKSHSFWFVIGGFRSILCVSVFQGSLLVIVIMMDGSEKYNITVKVAFERRSLHFWKAQ